MLNFGEMIRAVEAIEKTVNDATDGWANEAAIKKIEAQVSILRSSSNDSYISEKICIISEYTHDLYSPRKADKWGGSDQVKRTILTACQSLKDWARILGGVTD